MILANTNVQNKVKMLTHLLCIFYLTSLPIVRYEDLLYVGNYIT